MLYGARNFFIADTAVSVTSISLEVPSQPIAPITSREKFSFNDAFRHLVRVVRAGGPNRVRFGEGHKVGFEVG